jgi:hypothetical protein
VTPFSAIERACEVSDRHKAYAGQGERKRDGRDRKGSPSLLVRNSEALARNSEAMIPLGLWQQVS